MPTYEETMKAGYAQMPTEALDQMRIIVAQDLMNLVSKYVLITAELGGRHREDT